MCAHGLVRTEGGSTMIRCGFMPAYFPVLVLPQRSSSSPEWAFGPAAGRKRTSCGIGYLERAIIRGQVSYLRVTIVRQHHIASGLRRHPDGSTLIPGGASSGVAVTVPSSRYKSLAKKESSAGKAAFAMWVLYVMERVPNRAEPLEVKLTRPSSIKRIQSQPPVGSGSIGGPPALALT